MSAFQDFDETFAYIVMRLKNNLLSPRKALDMAAEAFNRIDAVDHTTAVVLYVEDHQFPAYHNQETQRQVLDLLRDVVAVSDADPNVLATQAKALLHRLGVSS